MAETSRPPQSERTLVEARRQASSPWECLARGSTRKALVEKVSRRGPQAGAETPKLCSSPRKGTQATTHKS